MSATLRWGRPNTTNGSQSVCGLTVSITQESDVKLMRELPPDLAALDDDDLVAQRAVRDDRLATLFRKWPTLGGRELNELRRLYDERLRLVRYFGRLRRGRTWRSVTPSLGTGNPSGHNERRTGVHLALGAHHPADRAASRRVRLQPEVELPASGLLASHAGFGSPNAPSRHYRQHPRQTRYRWRRRRRPPRPRSARLPHNHPSVPAG
jgi:hypothetical protein